VTRGSGTGPNVYRTPAQTINDSEAVLVADVVADKHRNAAAERGLRQEGGDRPAFPAGLGQQLDHHFPIDRFERAAAGVSGAPNEAATRRRERGRLTIMECQTTPLVLQPHAGVALDKTRQHRADADERRGHGAPDHVAVVPATLETVLPRDRARKRYEPAKLIERPPAHQGESTFEVIGERTKELWKLWRHLDQFGCSGDFDQRSIEIEKQRLVAS
jgi:hypothetical protein